jgi:hypothetical protein
MQTAQVAESVLPSGPTRARERGLQVESLTPGDRLIIRTASAAYTLTVIAPHTRQVLVWGGVLFPEPINARLDGCSSGGAFLRVGGIAVGCTLEFRTPKDVLVTAPVRSIGFVEHG